jgi:hypothetical protein
MQITEIKKIILAKIGCSLPTYHSIFCKVEPYKPGTFTDLDKAFMELGKRRIIAIFIAWRAAV